MRKIVAAWVLMSLAACSANVFPPVEAKAAKICLDAGLVPDTHGFPYRCYIAVDDERLK